MRSIVLIPLTAAALLIFSGTASAQCFDDCYYPRTRIVYDDCYAGSRYVRSYRPIRSYRRVYRPRYSSYRYSARPRFVRRYSYCY